MIVTPSHVDVTLLHNADLRSAVAHARLVAAATQTERPVVAHRPVDRIRAGLRHVGGVRLGLRHAAASLTRLASVG